MKILVVDVGGSRVKILATGQSRKRRMVSGPKLSAQQMVDGVKQLAEGWDYDAVSIGYPGVVKHDQPVAEPRNLGRGWVDFDYVAAFGCPVKIINDAAMQALGSYRHGTLLFLGLGTGLGVALVVEGRALPTELAHLPYRKTSFEDHVGKPALRRDGKKRWRKKVADVVVRLSEALQPDEVVLGGGNTRLLKQLPPLCRAGSNAKAFDGGFRLWEPTPLDKPRKAKRKGTHR
jgi:polyphosphate glucokinase